MASFMSGEEWKNKGNDSYRSKNYKEAIAFYTKAIETEPSNATYYSNRASAHVMLLNFKDSLSDCNQALILEPTNTKTLLKKLSALKGLGNLRESYSVMEKIIDLSQNDPSNSVSPSLLSDKKKIEVAILNLEKVKELILKKQNTLALTAINKITDDIGSNYVEINIVKAYALFHNKRIEESYNLTNSIMKVSPSQDLDLLILRANCLISLGDVDNSFKHFQMAVRNDPDNLIVRADYRKIKEIIDKKNSGDNFFRTAKYSDAAEVYSELIDIFTASPTISTSSSNATSLSSTLSISSSIKFLDAYFSKIYYNRSVVYSKLGKEKESIKDSTEAIRLNAEYTKAYIRRADSNLTFNEPETIQSAIDDLKKALELEEEDSARDNIKKKIKHSEVMLKRSKTVDLYAVLGVQNSATDGEIKSAYRKAALKYHPDKQASKSDEEKSKAESMFKKVNEAYEILSNKEKKARYDSGVDLEDLNNDDDAGHSHPFSRGGYGGGHSFHFGGGGNPFGGGSSFGGGNPFGGGIDPSMFFDGGGRGFH